MQWKAFSRDVLLLTGAWLACSSPVHAEPNSQETRQFSLYHLDGITEDTARGDMLYCAGLARPALSMRSKVEASHQYGLLGDLINGWLGKSPTDRMRGAVMDKCMTTHGYRLYRTDEATWKNLLDIVRIAKIKPETMDAASIDAMAIFASRPLPASVRIPQ